jgi:hypothetical protein
VATDLEPEPARTGEILVIQPLKDFECAGCGGTDDMLTMDHVVRSA